MFKILAEVNISKEKLRKEFLCFLLDTLDAYDQVTCPDCDQAFFIDLLPDDESTICSCGCEFYCEDDVDDDDDDDDDDLLPPM